MVAKQFSSQCWKMNSFSYFYFSNVPFAALFYKTNGHLLDHLQILLLLLHHVVPVKINNCAQHTPLFHLLLMFSQQFVVLFSFYLFMENVFYLFTVNYCEYDFSFRTWLFSLKISWEGETCILCIVSVLVCEQKFLSHKWCDVLLTLR